LVGGSAAIQAIPIYPDRKADASATASNAAIQVAVSIYLTLEAYALATAPSA